MMLSKNVSTAQPKQFCGVFSKPSAPHPNSAIVAYDRFGNAYMASELLPSGFEVLDGEIPATLEFSEDGCQEVCLILSAPESAPSVDAAVSLSRCGEVLLDETIPLQPDETSCFACEDCPSGNIVGAPGQATLLTDVLASGALPADGQFVQACVYGTLVINEDYYLYQSKLLMQPGARIVVENGRELILTLCELTGCGNMWRGIEVEEGGALAMKAYNYLADAQYAVYAHAAAPGEPVPYIAVEGNTFAGNFITHSRGGIFASNNSAGAITIGGASPALRNTLEDVEIGILANATDAKGFVNIANNDVGTQAGALGIGIWLAGNRAEAEVRGNVIEVGQAGSGIGLWYSRSVEAADNTVKLLSAAQAAAGIYLQGAAQCTVKDNTIGGAGAGGDNNGIHIFSSPDNAYCCNTIDNTRHGASDECRYI